MRIIVLEADAEGISWVGFCFTNPLEIIGMVSFNFTNGVSGGTSYDSITKPEPCPSGVLIPEAESGFYLKPGSTYTYSATASNNGKTYRASTTYIAPANKNIDSQIISNNQTCENKLSLFNQEVHVGVLNYTTWNTLWTNYSLLNKFMSEKKWNLKETYDYYVLNLESERKRLESLSETYSIGNQLKVTCWSSQIYDQYQQAVSRYFGSLTLFEQFQIDIKTYFAEWQQLQDQNNSYDDPAVFYEQVDHYFVKYVTSQIDELKAKGINFSFLTMPPTKPVWTNSRDGSNAIKVNNFTAEISIWWRIEGLRIGEAYAQHNLKNISTWIKESQASYTDYVNRTALEKFGSGGFYRFLKPVPVPTENLFKNPTVLEMENYENQLFDWASLEIKYLTLENYTAANNNDASTQSKICLTGIATAETYYGRFDNQINYLTEVWSSYERVLEILKSKNITLALYRIQIDQQVQNPYLTDLYDVVPQVLANVKANCGKSDDTSKRWAIAYSAIEKELSKLRLFLSTISTHFEIYSKNELKLIPKLGKVTQIVGGCQVEILNYDPTFKWYAKGEMIVDNKNIATIINTYSKQQYISTSKPGYQTVNYTEGIFDCNGLPKLGDNTVDGQSPRISFISTSKQEIYKGQSVIVKILITDNKELNNFNISLVDQIGQTYVCYEGVAWKSRIQGDDLIGVYEAECWVRSVSYEGIWSIQGYARDLSGNISVVSELTKIKILPGSVPIENSDKNLDQPSALAAKTSNFFASSSQVILVMKANIENSNEENKLVATVVAINNILKTTKQSRVLLPNAVKSGTNSVSETPKLCAIRQGTITRISKGKCSIRYNLIDNSGNTYSFTQVIGFK